MGAALGSLPATLQMMVAAGLLRFGVFSFVEALYRRIDAPDLDGAGNAVANGLRNIGSH